MIKARRLVKRFGNAEPVVSGVDLQAARGELVVVSSAAGVGASTLLRMLAGLVAPTSGVVEVDGQDLHALGVKARGKVAFADGWLDRAGELTAGEFLRFSGCAASAAARAEIDPHARLQALSAAHRRALSAAAALGSPRELLILDDVVPADEASPLLEWVRERVAAGAAVIMTGTAGQAGALGGRLLTLERGRTA